MNKILQKLPSLQEIRFDDVKYEASKTKQTIQQATCHNLVKLEVLSREKSNLLQAFPECQIIRKLDVWDSKVNWEKILQKYPSLEELNVWVRDNFTVSDQHEANATTHQLKVLKIRLRTNDKNIHEKLIIFILEQSNLQKFDFNSYNYCSPSQSLRQQLAAHICQLEHLTSLQIDDEKLFEEVEAFTANYRVANTRLQEFGWHLSNFKSPSSFLVHFRNLRKLNIGCWRAEERIVDLISFMNKTQLTSIKLEQLPSACFQLLQHLQVHSLQVLEIKIDNWSQDEVPAFDILQEFLPRHPNITQFEIRIWLDHDEPKSVDLIPMILATLTKLERLVVWKCPKMTPEVIEQIAALKTLKSWQINEYCSENTTRHKTEEEIIKIYENYSK